MYRTPLFRIIVCLLVLFLLQTSCLLERPRPVLDAGSLPAASFRWLNTPNRNERRLSHYDYLMRKYAASIGMDWRLLASIVWHESKFNRNALSPMGAKGLMQLRDVTALHFGRPGAHLFDPEENLELGTMLLKQLFDQFRSEGVASDDVLRFALASYNTGGGTLAKRREEAAETGLDPNKWDDVSQIIDKYNTTTTAYIQAVENTYARYCTRIQ